jgi:hypothetical protein
MKRERAKTRDLRCVVLLAITVLAIAVDPSAGTTPAKTSHVSGSWPICALVADPAMGLDRSPVVSVLVVNYSQDPRIRNLEPAEDG